MVNMSATPFHRQFKAVTGMSPLQYQKTLRLQEVRRLMLLTMLDAASAGDASGMGARLSSAAITTGSSEARSLRDRHQISSSTHWRCAARGLAASVAWNFASAVMRAHSSATASAR